MTVRHPLFARVYDRLSRAAEETEQFERRRELLAGVTGRVIEVGAGNGLNFRHYPATVDEVVAVEPEACRPGGGTTTLELTALRTPFLYFPLEHHFEQNIVVAERVARHGTGTRMRYSDTTPASLAEAIGAHVGRPTAWRKISTSGAARAAELIDGLLPAPARDPTPLGARDGASPDGARRTSPARRAAHEALI